MTDNTELRQLFGSVLLHDWQETTVNKMFDLLNNPETDIFVRVGQIKSIISQMDWGDIPHILDVYLAALRESNFHRVYYKSPIKLKGPLDCSWYTPQARRTIYEA